MIKLGMKSLDDVPTTGDTNANTWMLPDGDRKSALYSFCQEVIDEHVNFSFCSEVNCSTDGILNYANEVMSLGIFCLNYKNTVREGDGERVLLCWKYLLPIYSKWQIGETTPWRYWECYTAFTSPSPQDKSTSYFGAGLWMCEACQGTILLLISIWNT